jgi:hypothetical protein
MASIFVLTEKIFNIVLGLAVIILIYNIFSSVTQSSCFPSEIYAHDEVTGFRTGIFDDVYDNICTMFVDLNSGIYQVAKTWTARKFASNMLISMSNTIWSSAKHFCKTHTNVDYANSESSDAITDPEVFLELFLYESERCWSLFQGSQASSENRDPIPNLGFFDCAEIVYDFSENSDILTFDEIKARFNSNNTCSLPAFTPPFVNTLWCAPKHLMKEYWEDGFYDRNVYHAETEWSTVYDMGYSACRNYYDFNIPLYDFYYDGTYDGYGDHKKESVISGSGKIIISYFDYYDWKKVDSLSHMQSYDNYKACNYVDVFNNFESTLNIKYNSYDYKFANWGSNTLVYCFEKFDLLGNCSGTLNCERIKGMEHGTDQLGKDSFCDFSYSCKEEYAAFVNNCIKVSDSSSCNDLTYSQCRRNEYAGCNWNTPGQCVGTANCGDCDVTPGFNYKSECDMSVICKEGFNGLALVCKNSDSNPKTCASRNTIFSCLRAECAGCKWVK